MSERALGADVGVAPLAASGSPLVASRSLGRLIGLESLCFKIESGQPTGSWLDRSTVALVNAAVEHALTGFGVVGVDVWTMPLAVQCARAALRLVVLQPVQPVPASPSSVNAHDWLTALGARIVEVNGDAEAVRLVARAAVESAGLRLVTSFDPLFGTGLLEVVGEIEAAGRGDDLLAVPALTGLEPRWLTAAAERGSPAVPLPLDDLPPADTGRPFAVVGADGVPEGGHDPRIVTLPVTPREALAARRLLAYEEGLLVSAQGARGFAALVHALRQDRAKRLRERRLRQVTGAVVVLTGELPPGPEPSADAVSRSPVSLACLSDGLARLLVEPPGRRGEP